MLVHVDGDVIGYRAGYSAEHNFYHVHYMEDGQEHIKSFDGAKAYKAFLEGKDFGPAGHWVENELKIEPVEAALYNTRSILRAIAEDLQVDLETEVKVYLSGPTNFRNGIATLKPYKGNRDPNKKPVHAPAIKEMMRSRYGASTSDGQEADDDMGIAHYRMWLEDPASTVIATIDKDLDTIPGLHYNFVTKTAYTITPDEARIKFWMQMLTGDTVDNIPGVPKVGPAKAAIILQGWDGVDEAIAYDRVRRRYVEHYKDKADEALLEMGRLLHIRMREDYIWNPPTLASA